MKDFTGKEIRVGEKIAFLYHSATSSALMKGEVVGFTPKFVVVKEEHSHPHSRPTRVSPEKTIVIVEQEQPPMDEYGEIDWGELERRGDYRWHEQDTDRIRDGLSDGNYSVDRAQAREMGW